MPGPFGCRCLTSSTMPRFHVSPSSNRTGGFPASGSDGLTNVRHTVILRRTWLFLRSLPALKECSRLAPISSCQLGQNIPEVRPLSSTGITRLPRYYEPVRHPKRPGLSLTGVRLAARCHRRGFPVLRRPPTQTCRRHYPGGTADGIELLPGNQRPRPSPCVSWVGSRISVFEACSAFTRVTACLLAEPLKRSFPSKASAISLPPPPLRLLLAGATVARWDLPPLKNDAFHGALTPPIPVPS